MSDPEPAPQPAVDAGMTPRKPEPQDVGTRSPELKPQEELPRRQSAPEASGSGLVEASTPEPENIQRCQSCGLPFSTPRQVGFHNVQDTPSTIASNLSHQFSEHLVKTKTSFAHMEDEFKFSFLLKGQRVGTPEVKMGDLTATWDDKQMRGKDVHWFEDECLVSDPLWDQLTEQEREECKTAVENQIRKVRDMKDAGVSQKDKAENRRHSEVDSSRPRTTSLRISGGSQLSELVETEPSTSGLLERQYSSQLPSILGASIQRQGSAHGGHGTVYRALWKTNGRQVAIKVPNVMDENTEEMKFFTDLVHPNLVTCYGILEYPQGKCSIVTERCTTNLSAFLRHQDRWQTFHDEQLTPDKIDDCKFTILEHISQGLQKLHEMSVLHRDLKCDNILLDGDSGECEHCHHSGTWKICDFGEAKILETPMLSFHRPKPWKEGFDHRRFQTITSQSLYDKGARRYCWLHPGETPRTAAGEKHGPYSSVQGQAVLRRELEAIGKGKISWTESDVETLRQRALDEGVTEQELASLQEDIGQKAVERAQQMSDSRLSLTKERALRENTKLQAHHIIEEVLRYHNPYPHGALVYSFSENPEERDHRDRVFAVAAPLGTSATEARSNRVQVRLEQSADLVFPNALKPFNLIPACELTDMVHHVHVDLKRSVYRITRPQRSRDQCPRVTTLFSLFSDFDANDEIEGKISQPHPIQSTSALVRRRQRIPERTTNLGRRLHPPQQATHYVFAYQLPTWTTQGFNAEQLKNFDMYSGEISLASYGGFIYLNMPAENAACAEVEVVGVNALSMGPRTPYSGGVVGCSDKNITATVASPELWRSAFPSDETSVEDSSVGLETDIYAFGIVMWEVFTRRRAWHWRDCGQSSLVQFKKVVAIEHRRPKIPQGMKKECADMIRKCLHANPGRRPTAQHLAAWIRERRTDLRQQIASAAIRPVTESEMLNRSPDCSYAAARCWHHGKFSQHYITTTPNRKGAEEDGSVELTINECFALKDWEERALTGDTDEYEEHDDEEHQEEPDELQPLGIIFGERLADRSWKDHWPTITRIDVCNCNDACTAVCKDECTCGRCAHVCKGWCRRPRACRSSCRGINCAGTQTLAPEFPEIQVGCQLIEINGEPVSTKVDGKTVVLISIRDAVPMFKERLLRLKFSVPAHNKERLAAWATAQWPSAEIAYLPRWLREGGLIAIELVKAHEQKVAEETRVAKVAREGGLGAIELVKAHEQKVAEETKVAEEKKVADELSQARDEIADLKRQLAEAKARAGDIPEAE